MSAKDGRAAKARALAAKARAAYAADQLAPDAIIGEATKMAALGFISVRIAFDRALDLRDTPAAAALEKILKREGYKMHWHDRPVGDGAGNPTNVPLEASDLIVSW